VYDVRYSGALYVERSMFCHIKLVIMRMANVLSYYTLTNLLNAVNSRMAVISLSTR
jgi:hypothetical protein